MTITVFIHTVSPFIFKVFTQLFINLESAATAKSSASRASQGSFKSRVAAEKKKEADTRSQWNDSVTSEVRKGFSAEDRIANKIAQEVLKDNAKLRGVHSGASIKKLLEKEAKK